MKTKNELLNDLFDQWAPRYPEVRIIRDGIIDEDRFERQSRKILFIAREHNDRGNSDHEADFRIWWKQGVYHPFGHRIGQWNHSIPHGAAEQATLEQKHEAMKSIAFMNLKKVSGGSRAVHKTVERHALDDAGFLKKQIEIINPSVVVGCFGYEAI